MDAKPAIDINLKDMQGRTAPDHLWERSHSTGAMDLGKERRATAFRQLVDVCSEEYERAQGRQWQLRGIGEDPGDQLEVFHDALEDNSSQGNGK